MLADSSTERNRHISTRPPASRRVYGLSGSANDGDANNVDHPETAPDHSLSFLSATSAPRLTFSTRAFGFKEEMRVGTPSGGMHGEASFQGQLVMMGQGSA